MVNLIAASSEVYYCMSSDRTVKIYVYLPKLSKKNKSGTFLVHRVDVSLISADIGSSVEDGVVATSLDDLLSTLIKINPHFLVTVTAT